MSGICGIMERVGCIAMLLHYSECCVSPKLFMNLRKCTIFNSGVNSSFNFNFLQFYVYLLYLLLLLLQTMKVWELMYKIPPFSSIGCCLSSFAKAGFDVFTSSSFRSSETAPFHLSFGLPRPRIQTYQIFLIERFRFNSSKVIGQQKIIKN